jgi:hypothetical protein
VRRDPRLRRLSAEHHRALVLARRAWREPAAALRARFEADIAPHFEIEERVLLPALAAAGEAELVARTLADHRALRAELEAAEAGDPYAAARFGERLTAHVRFEERELFPRCEELPSEVLDEVSRI